MTLTIDCAVIGYFAAAHAVYSLRFWHRWFRTSRWRQAMERFGESVRELSQLVEHGRMDDRTRLKLRDLSLHAYGEWLRLSGPKGGCP